MKTLLLVHDGQSSPAPRVQYLEVAGYRVVALSTAQEALRAVGANPPDVLLVDVLVEGMNGFDLCRQVRKTHGPERLPIVMFSGIYRGRAYQDEALGLGVQAYLPCPVNLDEMVATVQGLLVGVESGERLAG